MEIDALSTTTCELKGRRWPRPSSEPLRPPAASPRVSSRPPSMLHADVRTNIHSLSHLTPLTPPGRSPPKLGAKCAQFVDIALAPWRRRTEDDPFSSLRQDRCATPVRGPIRPAGREAHNMAKQPAIDDLSTGAPPVLVPAGGKSSRLRLAGKVVSRPPAV